MLQQLFYHGELYQLTDSITPHAYALGKAIDPVVVVVVVDHKIARSRPLGVFMSVQRCHNVNIDENVMKFGIKVDHKCIHNVFVHTYM